MLEPLGHREAPLRATTQPARHALCLPPHGPTHPNCQEDFIICQMTLVLTHCTTTGTVGQMYCDDLLSVQKIHAHMGSCKNCYLLLLRTSRYPVLPEDQPEKQKAILNGSGPQQSGFIFPCSLCVLWYFHIVSQPVSSRKDERRDLRNWY